MCCSSGPAEIEYPVAQPKLLGGELLLLLASHRNGGGLGRPDDLECRGMDLDLSGRETLVARRLGPERHGTRHQYDRFRAQAGGALHHLGRRPLRVEGELHQPGPVAQVYEHETAEIPPAVNPPAQPDLLAQLFSGERPTAMSPECGGAHQTRVSASATTAQNSWAVAQAHNCCRRSSRRTRRAIRLRTFTC